jgi:zinc ribbon protein
MSSSQHCNNCGQELRAGARFCPECGRPLAVPVPPDTPRSTDLSSPAGSAPAAPEYSETVQSPASPRYGPANWPAKSAADPVPVPADTLPSFSSAVPAGPAAPPREPDHWLAADPPGPSPAEVRPKRSRRPLLAAIIAVVVLGTGTGVAIAAFPFHHRQATNVGAAHNRVTARPSPTAAPTSPSAAPTSSPASSPLPATREQAAQALSALLAQSGTDRTAVTQADNAVQDCSAGLSQDKMAFSQAASARQALLGKLAALPGRSALPAPMLQDLTLAWQASDEADQDFAKWTQDEIAQGCSTNDQSDTNFTAATTPDGEATKYKKAFAALWTPIATQYGLPAYQYNQL